MAAAEEVRFTLKVMMIKERNKVLYAEADSDFADILLSFLTLPLGTVVRLLVKHYGDNAPILGSLNSLYAGLLNMDDSHFWTKAGKKMLLNPINSSEIEYRRLKLQIDDSSPTQYFICGNFNCVSMSSNVKCLCSNAKYTTFNTHEEIEAQSGEKNVFTVEAASFLLTDDLCILTNTSASLFRILKLNGIEDTSVLEERTLFFGLKELMELLKGSLFSETPITDIILNISSADATLNKRKKFSALAKHEQDALPQSQTSENMSSDCKKITVKVLVQKSTNMVLLAEARQDFTEFLFSFLTIPLGRVQCLLGYNNGLGSINNLYSNVSKLEIGEYIKSRETISLLLEPHIAPYYLSSGQILSLKLQSSPTIHRSGGSCKVKLLVPTPSNSSYVRLKMIDSKDQDSFVKGPTKFMVMDDLAVSTPSSNLIIFILNQMKVPLSDVEEQELEIGMAEALSILKASLTSTCALSEGLEPFLKRRPKQEK